MVHVIEPDVAAHGPAALSGLAPAGAGLIAAATVAGAWLTCRSRGDKEIWGAAAAGALLVIAGLHLLPDAWGGAYAVRRVVARAGDRRRNDLARGPGASDRKNGLDDIFV